MLGLAVAGSLSLSAPAMAQTLPPNGTAGGASSGASSTGGGGGGGGGAGLQLTTSNSLTVTVTGAAGGAGGGENGAGSAGGSGSGTSGGIGGPGGGSVGGTGGTGGGGALGGVGTADSGSNGGLGGGGGGGAGLILNGSSLIVTTSGAVTAGNGGAGGGANSSFSGNLGNGGTGGAGLASASTSLQVSNSGTITGGAGGDAGFLGFLGSGATNGFGGAGGAGVSLAGDSTSFTNTGTLRGGTGGLLNTINSFTGSGAGGAGGAGLVISGASGTVSNSGTIRGASGGYDIDSNVTPGGASGAGVILSGSGTSLATGTVLTNNAAAAIVGANRDVLFATSGPDNGGAGVSITGNFNSLNNAGTITGGSAGSAGTAGVLVTGSNNYILTSGTITGGGSGGTVAPSVQFDGNNNTLELNAGYVLSGGAKVNGTGGTLVLGGATNAAFDLTRVGTSATSFNGFSAFSKTGASTWTLNGISTPTTNWSVQQGTLAMAASAQLTGDVSVASGATLSVLALSRVHGQVNIANGGTLATTTTTSAAALDGLTLSATSNLNMTVTRPGDTTGLLTIGNNGLTLDGTLNIINSGNSLATGTYRLFNVGSFTNNTMVIGTAPIQYAYVIDTTSTAFAINLVVEANTGYWNGGNTAPTGTVNGGSGTWNNSATNWTNAGGTVSKAWGGYEGYFAGAPGTVTVDGAGVSAYVLHFTTDGYTVGGGALTLLSLTAAKPTIEVTTGATATIQSVIAGTAGLDKTGAGTLILSGANTYTGNTNITAGTLQIDGGGSILGTLTNNGTVRFNPTSDLVIAGNVGGTGALIKTGANKVTLGGSANYSGATTISAGTLEINVTADATLAGTVANDSALIVNANGALSVGLTLSGAVSGTGSLTKNGLGALRLTADNSYSGLITVNAGTLYVGYGTTTGSVQGNIVINAPAPVGGLEGVAFFRSTASTYSGVMSGSGQMGVGGGGSLTLTGENTYTGNTFITGATLIIGNGGTTGSVLGDIRTDFPSNPSGTVAFNRSDLVTFPGAIFGTGGLEQRGTGTLLLTGANVYTGATRITQGTMQVGNGTTGSIPTATNVDNSGVLAFNQGADATFSGAITGTGSLTKMGTNTLTLTGANTYSGGTTISGGTLRIDGAGTIGPGNIANAGALVNNSTAANMTISGVISGTGSVTQSGVSTLILTGENTYTGGTTISAGVISIGNGTTTGSIVGNVVNNAVLGFARTNDYAFDGDISGTGFIGKTGAGVLTLTGANTYSGGTYVFAGTLSVGDGGANGRIAGNVAISSGANLTFNRSGTEAFAGVISGAGSLTKLGTGTLTLTGTDTYTGGTTISAGTLVVGDGATSGSIAGNMVNNATLAFDRSDAVTFAGDISGTGTINKQNTNTLTLTGNASGFTGTTNVNTGTLALSTSAYGGSVNVLNGATLTGAGNATGTVSVQNGGTIVVPTGGTTSYGTLALNQTSHLSLTLPGSVNTSPFYSVGNLTLDGVLDIASSGSYGYGTYRLMDYVGSLTNNTLDIGPSSPWQYTFSVIVDTATQQVNLLVDGNTGYWNGTSAPPSGSIRGGSGTWTSDPATFNWTDRFGSVAENWLNYKAVFAGTPGTVTIDNTYAQVQSAGMQFAVDGYTLTGGNLLLSNTINPQGQIPIQVGDGTPAGASMRTTIETVLTGTQGMTKTDLGTLILTANNTYTGGTTIAAGTLQLGNGGTTGSIVGDVVNNGTLAFNRSDAVAFAGNISGTGGVTQLGTSTLTLSGTNTYSGATNVASGTLVLSGGSAIGDLSAVTVAAGASLISSAAETIGSLAGAGSVTVNSFPLTVGGDNSSTIFSGVVSGTAGLIKAGTGTMTLSGINTNTGGTSVSAGRLIVSSGSALSDTAAVFVTAGATLELANANETVGAIANGGAIVLNANTLTVGGGDIGGTFSGSISGTGGLTKIGLGQQSLSGTNTFTGPVLISAGTLIVQNGAALSDQSAVTVDAGAIFGVLSSETIGSLAGAGSVLTNATVTLTTGGDNTSTLFSGVISELAGALSLAKTGTGTLTLTGANTYVGGTTISGGTLQIGNGGTTGSILGNVTNNGALAFNRSDAVTYAGVVSGTGALVKAGSGVLTLTGANTYTGGTTISSGTLQIGNGGTTGWLASAIANSGTLVFNRSDDVVAPGTVTGTGALVQRGAGKLTLAGANSAGAGTTVEAGTLEILAGVSLASNVTVQSGATLKGETSGGTAAAIVGAVNVLNGGTLLAAPTATAGTYGLSMTSLALADNAIVSVVLGSNTGNAVFSAGTLALDGVLNVTNAGAMALGVYRIMDYTTLASDGGLRLGTTPLAFAYEIQQLTGQVNLAVLNGDILYWNGSQTTPDGTVHGGAGTWTGAAGPTNWTTTPANQSRAWNNSFAVFGGTAGAVTIDDTAAGAVSATGLQFMVNGYTVSGDALTLAATSGQTPVRVGDGTPTGAAYVATVSSVLTGTTGLEKTDLGTLILTAANTYTGGTTITQGTLQVGDGGTSGSILGDVVNNGTLAFNRLDDISYAGVISGSGSLSKAGAGTLTLTGANSFSGATSIAAGRLLIGGGSSLSDTAGVAIAAGALLELMDSNESIGGLSGAGNVALNSYCLTVAGGGGYSGTISGAGCLVKTGTGTLTLAGTSTYSGGTTVSDGTVQVTAAGALGTGTLALQGPGVLRASETFTYASAISLTPVGGLGGGTFEVDDTKTLTLTGAIAGLGNLDKTGTGTLVLGGTGTYGGATNVNAGIVIATGGQAVGDTSSVTVATGAQFILQGNETVGSIAGAGALTLDGATLTTGGTNASTSYTGAIGGSGGLTKTGTGTLTLTGANTYAGATSISGGQLVIGGGSSLSDTAGLTVAAGAGLQLTDANEAVGSLAGAGSVALGGNCLTTGGDNSSTSFSGTISGSGCVTKTGTGTLELTGTNTYAGTTTVSGGAVQVTAAAALGTGALALEGPGTLRASETFTYASAISLTPVGGLGGGTLEVDATKTLTVSNVVSGAGGLTKAGTGTLVMTGPNTYTGATTVGGGQLVIGGGSSLSDTAGLTVAAGAGLQLTDANETIGSLAGAGSVALGGNCLTTGGDNSSTGFSGSISGSGCLTKTGTGTLALTGISTYSGTTTVSGGAVQVISAGALGTGALALEGPGTLRASETFTYASAISLTPVGGAGGGTFEVDASKTLTLTGVIAGLGNLDKTGTGTLVIGGANTYSGLTNVNAGILVATGGQAISDTGAVTVAGGAQFILQGNETVGSIAGAGVLTLDGASLTTGSDNTSTIFSGAIGGTGGLTKTGSGVLTLSGASSYSGDTQVAGGGLSVAGSLGGDVYVQNLATLSGSGSVAGTVHVLDGGTLSGAPLSGLTMGGLDLASAATLNVALGAPSAGSTFNVNGNVTLDGTLTVTATPGFGLGIYRIMNYTGTLTDNGMTVGGLPGGLEGGLQSSIANQVNLFVEDPNSPILFWNGTNTVATQTVKGGSGTWTADAQTNWINASATIPKSWNSGFAVFQGAAGTVTVDNTAAQVASVGMQFVTSGYVVSGGALQLTGTQAAIRVGDGTLAGASTVATIASALVGTAGLEKSDFGTLILTGANTYSGGTTVSGGTLQIGNGGTSGAILGNVVTNAVLAYNRSDDIAVAGTISGIGGLTKLGAGTLTLSGANSYGGGTSIQAGTLQLSNATALGTGGLALSGAATLRASATFATANAVSLTSVGGAGGGTFNVDASQTLTLSGAVSGSGSLIKSGDGLLILTGAGSYAGLTTISAGTLQIGNGGTTGSIAGDIVNNASLVFNRSDTYAFSGAITGSGAVTFTGGGTVLFSSPYTGPVAVNNSSVQLQAGSVTSSPFTVNAGGVLGGTATIGGLTVNNGGTAAPGYSPGTLTVNGPVTFNAGGIYAVDVTPAGAHDLIIATGPVTLSSGASVQVLAVPGQYNPTSNYAIITTSGTVTGTFGAVTSDYAFLAPQLTYDAQNVYLTLTYTGADFVDFATTANQTQVAVAAQALGTGNAIFDALLSLPNPAVAPAFNQLSGEAYASANTVIQQQSIYLREAVGTRLRQSVTAHTPDALSTAAKAAGPATALLSQELTPTVWMQGYGGWGNSFGNTNAASISNTIGGVFGGLDVAVTDTVRMGMVGGFSQSSFDVNARNSSGSIDNYDIALYAGGQFGAFALRGGLAYTWHDMQVSRSVTFPGFAGGNSSGYSLGTAQVFGELGYDLKVGAYAFEPFAGLAYVNVSGGAFTEGGSLASALSVDGASQNTLYSTLGLRAATSLQLGGHTLSPSLTVGWQHAFGDTTPSASMLFSGGATPFQIQGVPIAENAALLGAGLAYQVSDRATLQVNYTGQIAAQSSQNAFTAQFSLKF